MSAKLPSDLSIKELVKHTGYICECDERACCCLSDKLKAWVNDNNEIIYTKAEVPLNSEYYYYVSTRNNQLKKTTFDDITIITAESIYFGEDDVYYRDPQKDL